MAKHKKCRKAGLCPKVNGQLSLDLAEVNIVEEWINTSKKKLTVIDLFAGRGGASCGFEMAGIEVIAGLDFDQPACKSYCNNFSHPIIQGDIRLESTKQHLYDVVGDRMVDIIFAGFPCQSFSMAGLRREEDDRNFLYREFVEIVKHIKPTYIVAENVGGFLTKQNGIYPELFRKDFASIGYGVDFALLNAADYTVPQKRERTVVIGNNIGIPNLFPKSIVDRSNWVTVMDAIGDLTCAQENRSFGQIYTRHHESTIEGMKTLAPKGHLYPSRNSSWRVLPTDEPAFTMTENHGAPGIHPFRGNMITPREMARLQSFPDCYDFSAVSKTQMLKQIGNAVPPLLAKAVGLAIAEMDKRVER